MTQEELFHLVKNLITEGEKEYIEFKVNNFKPEIIGQDISALANGAALHEKPFGYFVWGVEDETCKIVGTSFSFRMKIGNEPLENWLMQRLNPRIDIRFFEISYDSERNLVIIQIPAAHGQSVSYSGTRYIRIGSVSRKLQDFPEKEQKLWREQHSEYELGIAKYSVSATDVISLLDIQTIFDFLLKIPQPTTQEKILEKLEFEKLIVRDNEHYNITRLGAFLFAKNLQSFGLERKAPRVIKYKKGNKLETEKDQLGVMGYGSGFNRLMMYIDGLLPSNEVIGNAMRTEVSMYPQLAVRELVANAIIHQDLSEMGTYLTVEIYDDRIEVSNTGNPAIEPLRFIDSYNAKNLHLATAMRRMGFCEEKGSGIDKVVSQCEVYQLPAPDFRVYNNQTIAILYAHKDFNLMEKEDKIRACYQHCCLMFIMHRKMTNQSLRERFKIKEGNAAIVSRIIKDTLAVGLIKPDDPESTSRKFKNYLPSWV